MPGQCRQDECLEAVCLKANWLNCLIDSVRMRLEWFVWDEKSFVLTSLD